MEASALLRMLQLIDAAWTLLPPLMAAVYSTHPHAVLTAKAAVAHCLLAAWSVRLTHSYFRRQVLRPYSTVCSSAKWSTPFCTP